FLFKILIKKFNLKTPGREDDDEETKLYTRADMDAAKEKSEPFPLSKQDKNAQSIMITRGLGGKANISDVDCCATRLRCTVYNAALVSESILKQSGAAGVVIKGNGVQVIYGPRVTVIKSDLEDFLDTPEADNVMVEVPEIISEEAIGTENTVQKSEVTEMFNCPIEGQVASITETPDDVFSQKMLGDGIVVFPTGSEIVAPCDGTVEVLFPTKHAIGLKSLEGTELLIHVGIDTVKLEGQGFDAHIKQGDTVKKGDKLMTIDLEFLEKNAPSTAVPMIFTGLPETKKMTIFKTGDVKTDESIVEIIG
ncbi:MAG: glucose PTS transporter subunit IIA, partial [Eubacterium sp.]